MEQAQQREFVIENGPSLLDLQNSLFGKNCEGCHKRPVVRFYLKSEKLQAPYVLVAINRLEREDGSGELWIFDGYLTKDYTAMSRGGKIVGLFSTRDRKGRFEVLPAMRRSCAYIVKDILKAEMELTYQDQRRAGYNHVGDTVPDSVETDIRQKSDAISRTLLELRDELARNHR